MYRRPVALKLISEALGSDPRALSRFDLEIETAANLQHPNIVTIYDRGESEGRRFFVMELLEGVDLSAAVKDRAGRTLEDRLEVLRQLCEALDFAHRQGVVHRDIKPANIMLVRAGGADHVKLLDFGIAKVSRADRTRTVVQPGTLFYMSPEQLRDDVVDAGSDLFAVGIVAYELCCGVHPFQAKTEYLVSSNIMLQKQPPARSHDPSLPEALDVLFDRLLEKERDKRPATAGDVAAEIRRLLGQLRGASTDSQPHVYGKLDEMTTSMVERLVHWAKTKEAAGAYVEALEGFKRALLLAPEARWLEPAIARLEARLASGASTELKGVAADIVLPSLWNDSTEVGENTLDNHLPWDVIDSSSFEKVNLVQPELGQLTQLSSSRIATNKEFAYMREDIERVRLKNLQPPKPLGMEAVTPSYLQAFNPNISLYHYQIRAMDAIAKEFDEAGKRKFLLEMATGTGKTLLCAALIRRF
jgi:serine/threonine protein kinase